MADSDEAQAQQQLDELTNHFEKAFLEYTGSLDSEPEELDEASIDEVFDRFERRCGNLGNPSTASVDLSSDLGLAILHAGGKKFIVAPVGTVLNIPGKTDIGGTLSGKQAYAIKSLPFGFFTIVISDTKGRVVGATIPCAMIHDSHIFDIFYPQSASSSAPLANRSSRELALGLGARDVHYVEEIRNVCDMDC